MSKYLILGILFIIPFSCFYTWILNFNCGVETCVIFLTLPICLIIGANWIMNPEKNIIYGGLVLTFLVYEITTSLYSRYGFSPYDFLRLMMLFSLMLYIADSQENIMISVKKTIAVTAVIECVFVGAELLDLFGFANVQAQAGIRGTIGTDNYLAMFCLVALPCGMALVRKKENGLRWRIFGVISCICSVGMCALAQSRAGYLLMTIQIVIFAISILKDSKKIFVLCCILLFAFLFIANRYTTKNDLSLGDVNILFGRNNPTESGKSFAYYTKEIFKAHPLIGVGGGNWKKIAEKEYGLIGVWAHCHNELGQSLSEYGIIGTLILYSLVILVFYMSATKNVYVFMIIFSLIAQSFVTGLRNPMQTIYFGIFAGLALQDNIKSREKI
jgi:hypothetical protein